jgi:nucleotidyltransferase/DNA polymerase involved in DNA repair
VPVVCVLAPAYKVAIARARDAALAEVPVIVADRRERGHAIAVCPAAYALGARVGMTLVQAAAAAREAAVVVDDPARGRALWERLLDTLDAASPLVEDAGDGVAYLEMRGIPGSERAWLASVRDALAADAECAALPIAAGFATNKFAARMAALAGNGTIVRIGEERAFVAALPLHVLGLDPATLERLDLLGIRDLRTLAALPHGPFVRRFGPESADWHARANGVDATPVVPRARRIAIERTLFGEGTAEREEQLLFALRTLVARVADDIAYAGKRCGALELELECEDGDRIALATTLAQPTAQSTTLFDLLRARLEGTVLQSPVIGLRLIAQRLEEGGTELSLFAGSDPDPEVVGIALARLEAALGPRAVRRASVVAGYRYEARAAYEAFAGDAFTRAPRVSFAPPVAPSETGTLAYRILAPRAIEVRVLRGRPAIVTLPGAAPSHVIDVAGPWRVDEAWWAEALAGTRASDTDAKPIVNDAYDVLLDDGALLRIVDERGTWFLCGSYD